MIRAGRLRDKILLKRKTSSQDGFGRKLEQYQLVTSLRCDVEVINGVELIKSGIALNAEYISILARFDNRVTHDLYIEWEGNLYSLNTLKPAKDKGYMVIAASRQLTS